MNLYVVIYSEKKQRTGGKKQYYQGAFGNLDKSPKVSLAVSWIKKNLPSFKKNVRVSQGIGNLEYTHLDNQLFVFMSYLFLLLVHPVFASVIFFYIFVCGSERFRIFQDDATVH